MSEYKQLDDDGSAGLLNNSKKQGSVPSAPSATAAGNTNPNEFDHGTVDIRDADDRLLHRHQNPLTCGEKVARTGVATFAGLLTLSVYWCKKRSNSASPVSCSTLL